jgi:hypothetical protein
MDLPFSDFNWQQQAELTNPQHSLPASKAQRQRSVQGEWPEVGRPCQWPTKNAAQARNRVDPSLNAVFLSVIQRWTRM